MTHRCSDNGGLQPPELPLSMEPPAAPTPAEQALDNNFRVAARDLKRDLVRCMFFLRSICDGKVHLSMGFMDIYSYAEACAGFSRHQTKRMLETAAHLRDLPDTRKALVAGNISFSKARAIADRADPETENHWLKLAAGMSTAQLPRQLPSGRVEQKPVPTATPVSSPADPQQPGTAPPAADPQQPGTAPPAPDLRSVDERCHITYSLTPEDYQIWCNLNELLSRQHRGAGKESLLLRGLVALREDKVGPRGHCNTLLRIDVCPACSEASLLTGRGRFQVPRSLLEAARCDAVIENQDARRRQVISPRLRRAVLRRDHHRCQSNGCTHTQFLQIHHRVPVIQGGLTELENLVTLCSTCHRTLHEHEENLSRAARDPAI